MRNKFVDKKYKIFFIIKSHLISILISSCLTFAASSVGLAFHVVQKSAELAQPTAQIAKLKAANKIIEQKYKKKIAKEKIKSKIKLVMSAMPFIGIGTVGYFEYHDYQDWKALNPESDPSDYVDHVQQQFILFEEDLKNELPEKARSC
ncbi:hypothetical protein [Rhodothalassium salexigens]|uniref:hypothetical protein n=1 Tax=Rhodothalassium salexigens TaxID=1086 RepID=UPI00104F6DE5|nr:hypothetical protein [Rhodothalassium salexigens]MBB4212341.1 mannitol-specific phosphotransferase system IIBC component [Rhodothalassium salexigens DSM 2132]